MPTKGRVWADRLERYHPYFCGTVVAGILVGYGLGQQGFERFIMPGHCVSSPSAETKHAVCHKGLDDFLFVIFMFNLICLLRVFYRAVVLEPIARYLKFKPGVANKFLESGWFALYFIVVWTWGVAIFKDAEWWFDTKHFWIGYPHTMNFRTKLYYLSELSFWIQCLFVFIFEVPRRDRIAYLVHHFVTIALICSSYYFNFTRIGAAILLQTNVGDIFYWNSKILKYARFEKTSMVSWISFVVVWILSRHVIFGFILYSLWFEVPLYVDLDGYDASRGYYVNRPIWLFFSILLVILKFLMLYWLWMIVKVIWNIFTKPGSVIEDTTEMSDEDEDATPKTFRRRSLDSPANVKAKSS